MIGDGFDDGLVVAASSSPLKLATGLIPEEVVDGLITVSAAIDDSGTDELGVDADVDEDEGVNGAVVAVSVKSSVTSEMTTHACTASVSAAEFCCSAGTINFQFCGTVGTPHTDGYSA